MRVLTSLVAILFFSASAIAQRTVVSGTVKDSNGTPYSGGTLVATLSLPLGASGATLGGVQIGGATQRVTLDTTGSFLMQLPDNAIVLPGGTQWTFNVNISPGVSPPLGTGPQSCSATLTITGATQSVSTSFNACPVLANIATSSVFNSGANVVTAQQLLTAVSLGGFGALFDVTSVIDASTTNGTNIVTCPNSDCKFLTGPHPAVVGEIFFANMQNVIASHLGCTDDPDILFGGARQTTILSVDSDTQIHVVGNSDTTTVALACIAWGHDDTTALNAAWAAAGCNAVLYLPGGSAFVSAPVFQAIGGCPTQSQRIAGSSLVGSAIVPVPSFNFTAITGSAGPSCTATTCAGAIGNYNIVEYQDFSVYGVGERCAGALANTTLWLAGQFVSGVNNRGSGWCARGGGTTLTGLNIVGGNTVFRSDQVYYFGSVEVNLGPAALFTELSSTFVQGTGQNVGSGCVISVQPAASGTGVAAVSDNLALEGQFCLGTVGSGTGATWTSRDGLYDSKNGEATAVIMGNNSAFFSLANDTFYPTSAGTAFTFTGSTGASVHAHGANFLPGPGAFGIVGAAGNTFVDDGDNTWSVGIGPAWNGLGAWNVSGPQLFLGKGTGVCTASQTLFLYPTGQTSAGTCTITVESLLNGQGVVTATGTIHVLRCTSTAGGVNASSGTVTVRKNGVNTALTVTFGTGTLANTLSSSSTQVSVVPGDVITYSITTQAAETLAGVACQVQVN